MKRKHLKRRIRRAAFTLMEVMLVLVIIAAIAGLAITNLGGIGQRANERAAKAKISVLEGAVDWYKMEMQTLPPDLDALYEKPSSADANKWMQFLKEPPGLDPWGRPFEYSINGDAYEIRSLGPDGQRSDDDIVGSR